MALSIRVFFGVHGGGALVILGFRVLGLRVLGFRVLGYFKGFFKGSFLRVPLRVRFFAQGFSSGSPRQGQLMFDRCGSLQSFRQPRTVWGLGVWGLGFRV